MPKATLMPNIDIADFFMLNGRMDIPPDSPLLPRAQQSQTLPGIRFGESKAQAIIQNKPAWVNKTRFHNAQPMPGGPLPAHGACSRAFIGGRQARRALPQPKKTAD